MLPDRLKHQLDRWAPRFPWLFWSAVGLVCAVVLWRRLEAMDPPSLWFDDLWPALAATKMPIAQWWTLRPTAPFGFLIVTSAFHAVFRDPEWSVQLFPMLASVAQIPLAAWLALRLTRNNTGVALVAAALVAIDPVLNEFACRVKQYPSDGLVTWLLLIVGLPLLDEWSWRRALRLAAGGAVGLFFSFTSVFTSAALLNLAALRAVVRAPTERKRTVALAVGFDVVLLLIYALLLRGQSRPSMEGYWHEGFIPIDDLGAALSFLTDHGARAFADPLPPLTAALVVVGVVVVWAKPDRRLLGLFFVGVAAELLVSSALRLYPMGTGRTGIGIHPIAVTFAAVGLHALVSRVELRAPAVAACWLGALVLLFGLGRPAFPYARNHDARLVALLVEEATPADGLVVIPHASYAAGYYGDWPLGYAPGFEHGFTALIERPRTLNLPYSRNYRHRPHQLDASFATFFRREKPRRVFYLSTHTVNRHRFHEYIRTTMAGYGYTQRRVEHAESSQLAFFELLP